MPISLVLRFGQLSNAGSPMELATVQLGSLDRRSTDGAFAALALALAFKRQCIPTLEAGELCVPQFAPDPSQSSIARNVRSGK